MLQVICPTFILLFFLRKKPAFDPGWPCVLLRSHYPASPEGHLRNYTLIDELEEEVVG